MNRSPFLLRRTPPSPRTPSVTRMPRTLGGQIIAVGSKCTRNALAVFEQPDDGVFHEHVETEMDSMILQRPDHLEARAVSDMRQPRISMTAEIALQDAPIACAIEEGAPCFQFANARRSLLRMEFCHSPVAQILAATHRVGKMY